MIESISFSNSSQRNVVSSAREIELSTNCLKNVSQFAVSQANLTNMAQKSHEFVWMTAPFLAENIRSKLNRSAYAPLLYFLGNEISSALFGTVLCKVQ
jgi:hypothetical protein